MKKRIYSFIAVSILFISAAGLFLIMTTLFDLLGNDLTLKSDREIAVTAIY